MYVLAEVDRDCEGIPILSGCAINTGITNLLTTPYGPITSSPTMTISDSVMLEMKWSGNTALWYYTINGGANTTFANFTVPSYSHSKFVVGTKQEPYGGNIRYF